MSPDLEAAGATLLNPPGKQNRGKNKTGASRPRFVVRTVLLRLAAVAEELTVLVQGLRQAQEPAAGSASAPLMPQTL